LDSFDAGPMNTASQGSTTVGMGLPLGSPRFYRGAAQPPYTAATEAVAVLAVQRASPGSAAAAAVAVMHFSAAPPAGWETGVPLATEWVTERLRAGVVSQAQAPAFRHPRAHNDCVLPGWPHGRAGGLLSRSEDGRFLLLPFSFGPATCGIGGRAAAHGAHGLGDKGDAVVARQR
jgi:hypothetical protein